MAKKSKYSKKEIGEKILEEINDHIMEINGSTSQNKVISVDTKNETITIQLGYTIVEEDNYIGLACY